MAACRRPDRRSSGRWWSATRSARRSPSPGPPQRPVAGVVACSPIGMIPLELRRARFVLPFHRALAATEPLWGGAAATYALPRRAVFGWFVGMASLDGVDPEMGREMLGDAARSAPVVAAVMPALAALDLAGALRGRARAVARHLGRPRPQQLRERPAAGGRARRAASACCRGSATCRCWRRRTRSRPRWPTSCPLRCLDDPRRPHRPVAVPRLRHGARARDPIARGRPGAPGGARRAELPAGQRRASSPTWSRSWSRARAAAASPMNIRCQALDIHPRSSSPPSTRRRCCRSPSAAGRCSTAAPTRASSGWRPCGGRGRCGLLGRDADLTREQQLELRLEQRLANLQAEIERARCAGDEDAAQAAHARYIELGTTFVRRFVLIENGRPGTAD